MLRWTMGSVLLSTAIAFASQAAAQPPGAEREPAQPTTGAAARAATDPTIEQVHARIERLAQDGANRHARPAIRHARLALVRANDALRRGDEAASVRARQIAWAALSLAARRVSLAREREALAAAEIRAEEARTRAASARAALTHAMAERARILRGEAHP